MTHSQVPGNRKLQTKPVWKVAGHSKKALARDILTQMKFFYLSLDLISAASPILRLSLIPSKAEFLLILITLSLLALCYAS